MNHLRPVLIASLAIVALCAIISTAAESKAPAKQAPAKTPWSFLPLRESPTPSVRNKQWPQSRMDQFLLAKQEKAGLKPAPPADPRALIRRLYFDLTGLPPTPEEVEAFVKACGAPTRPHSPSPIPHSLVAATVDRLLSSPAYGERYARYWLDLARYVDETASWLEKTSGAHLYRDWVIKAFNDDLPYDQFVMRQIAADRLIEEAESKADAPPEKRPASQLSTLNFQPSRSDIAALAFLGLAPTYWKELQLPPDLIKGTVADEWEEHVDTLSRTFLGLTLACARCHDHKSDPITAADYYGIAGVFASVRHAEVPTMGNEFWLPVKKARESVAALEKERDELKKKKPAPTDLTNQVAVIEAKITGLKSGTPHFNMAMATAVEDAALFVIPAANNKGTVLDFKPGQARDLELMKRGDPNNTGDIVPRRFLSAFPAKDGQPRRFTTGSGRLELAQAIVRGSRAAHRARHCEPHLAAPFRPRHCGDAQRVRRHRRRAFAPRVARRPHRALHQARLVHQVAAPRNPPFRRVAAKLPRTRLRKARPGEPPLRPDAPPPPRLRGVARHHARRRRHAGPQLRRRRHRAHLREEPPPHALRHREPPRTGADAAHPRLPRPRRAQRRAHRDRHRATNALLAEQPLPPRASRRLRRAPGEGSRPRVERPRHPRPRRPLSTPPTAKELAMATRFLTGRETDKKAWSEYAQALLASNETQFVD